MSKQAKDFVAEKQEEIAVENSFMKNSFCSR